jgi:heme/copper-type cytochrome/quinol oxidase subunit 3
MNPILSFWAIFATIALLAFYCDLKYDMLKDASISVKKPYSWSRVQLAWWIVIVLSAFITIICKYAIAPTLNESTVILIGISSATIAAAKVIDVSDENNTEVSRHQDKSSSGFFLDIISDEKGASIHRFQTVVFNITFGVYFIVYVLNHLKTGNGQVPNPQDLVMPNFENNNLVLLGLSSGTYAALKLAENKTPEKEQNNAISNNNEK